MKTFTVALNTGRQAIRTKALYWVFLCACVATGISAAFGSASIGDISKFVKDFSLCSISLSGVVATVVLGVNLLNTESAQRAVDNTLSKPAARWQFLVGKYLGLLATLLVMPLWLTTALLALLWPLEHRVAWELLPAIGAMMLELAVLLAVATCFSSIVVTPALAGLLTAGTFIAGRLSGGLAYFSSGEHPAAVRYAMTALYVMLPHLDRFYVADRVVSGVILPPAYYLYASVYALAYSALLLLLSAAVFPHRKAL